MNYRICIIAMAALTLAWGCTSDSDENSNDTLQVNMQQVDFEASEAPDWDVDWTWTDENPGWVAPDPNTYGFSMQLQVQLSEDLAKHSSDNDSLAAFINGTCRGVALRNIIEESGDVIFLISIDGNEDELGQLVQLKYYSSKLKNVFTNGTEPDFEPSNLWGSEYKLIQIPEEGNKKYPYVVNIEINIENDSLPFRRQEGDNMGIFIDGMYRGLLVGEFDKKMTLSGTVLCTKKKETGQLRYYSAEKGGIYTFSQTFEISEDMPPVSLSF